MKKSMRDIEDVLSKIGEFIFSVDFIVLESKPVANYNTISQLP